MSESKYGAQNSVTTEKQLTQENPVAVFNNNGNKKILFAGNSITYHAPLAEIGWSGNWGMAATSKEKDYVHQVISGISEKTPVDYCIAQLAQWERSYENSEELLNERYASARDFEADLIIIRLGENVDKQCDYKILKKSFDYMIKFLNAKGNAKVIVTTPFWKKEKFNEMLEEISNENNYVYLDISELEQNKETMALGQFEHRGVSVHPSDFGMKCIAEKILSVIGDI